jgi:hypothetical protein
VNFEAKLREVLDDHWATAQDCDMCGPHMVCGCGEDWSDKHLIELVTPVFTDMLTELSNRIGKAADELAMLSAKNSGDERVRITGKATGASLAQGYVQELLRMNA